MTEAISVCVLARMPNPHLEASVGIFRHVLGHAGASLWVTDDVTKALLHAGPVLVMQLEQYNLRAHLLAIARAVMRRRTCAMVFRSREALVGTKPQTRVKRLLLRVERRLSSIAMLTIVPFDLLPRPETLFRGWLHDPQLWDIAILPAPDEDRGLADRALTMANGRPIIIVIGLLASYKGIDRLAELANDADFCAQYLLVIAGSQIADVKHRFADIANDCIIEDRHISDGEIYALYEAADYVWSVYAPSYDQASGIFGRALQFGRTPLVRAGSLIEHYAKTLGRETVAVDWEASPSEIARMLSSVPGKRAPYRVDTTASFETLTTSVIGRAH
ncbi:hypothetical protein [Sphingomonas sp. GV3]|uniref:hypothetical protein n=1 Tax=Sphingomonas sp. GV3 TaxID=3040671 RepID=UPI00280B4EB1|nr:hypothetical protein [Sphingomonas sp. GV3]